MIYYGWLIADAEGTPNKEAKLIALARPQLLIASFYTFEPKYINLSEQVRDLLHNAGVRIFAYVDTDYGNRDQEAVEAEIDEYLSYDIEGIFFDRVYNFLDSEKTRYYRMLHNFVRNRGKGTIANTGIAQPGQDIMRVTDILMVEHDWRDFYQNNPWAVFYPPVRFMGNSSNEHYFSINCETAIRDTYEAWANGVSWHYSTDRYTTLPDWFMNYVSSVGYGG